MGPLGVFPAGFVQTGLGVLVWLFLFRKLAIVLRNNIVGQGLAAIVM
jgi:hypothetical protein